MELNWRKIGRVTLMLALAFFSFLMIRLTLPYTSMSPGTGFLKSKQYVYYTRSWRWSFYTHVFSSCLVLMAGFTQFSGYILLRWPKVHRICGYAYLITALFISGPAAWWMGVYANGGFAAKVSFVLQASLWLIFTGLAWWFALSKRWLLHGAFLYRSYALALAAISLRGYTYILEWLSVDIRPRDIYIATAWMSWVPNLLIAEWLIQYRGVQRMLKGRKPKDGVPPVQTSPKA
jgi:hypothetical protein